MKRIIITLAILVIFGFLLSVGMVFVHLSHGTLETYAIFCVGVLTSEVVDYLLSKPISR